VTTGRDDDALSWDGDDDPTLDTGTPREPTSTPVLPEGFTAVGRGAEDVGRVETDTAVDEDAAKDADAPAGMGNTALITLGALGGIYLLLSIGWLIGANRISLVAGAFLDPTAFLVTVVLAILAPPLWFVTTLLLTRGRHIAVRIGILVVGALLLVPWPFVLAGARL
jgi:hypothetical protein